MNTSGYLTAMGRPILEGLRKSAPWLIVLVVFVVGASYLILLHLGTTLAASAAVQLEQYLIQINGLLIAFTGIIFTGMLAEIRFRTERALQGADHGRLDKLERTSRALRTSALAGFIFFSASLADAIGNLAAALASPSSRVPMADAFVLPTILMVGGLALQMVALTLVAVI